VPEGSCINFGLDCQLCGRTTCCGCTGNGYVCPAAVAGWTLCLVFVHYEQHFLWHDCCRQLTCGAYWWHALQVVCSALCGDRYACVLAVTLVINAESLVSISSTTGALIAGTRSQIKCPCAPRKQFIHQQSTGTVIAAGSNLTPTAPVQIGGMHYKQNPCYTHFRVNTSQPITHQGHTLWQPRKQICLHHNCKVYQCVVGQASL
jgi:hypothetical protein